MKKTEFLLGFIIGSAVTLIGIHIVNERKGKTFSFKSKRKRRVLTENGFI